VKNTLDSCKGGFLMRILFITPRLPYPPDRGDRVRVYNFAKVLAERHSLSLCSLIQSKAELKYVKVLQSLFTNVELIVMRPWKSWLNVITYLLSTSPAQVAYFYSSEMKKRVSQIVKRGSFDLIYTFHLRAAPYVSKLDLTETYTVLDLTDSVSLLLRRLLPYTKPYLRPVYYREWLTTQRYEALMANQFDECWLISNVDKRVIEELAPNARLFVIPNGVDLSYFSPPRERIRKPHLIFVGYMGIESVDAVLYFYKKIFPLIRKEIPQVKFYVIGANPPRQIVRLGEDKDVVITGYVEDLRPYYSEAAAMVAPMRFVVGVQNKILEAMAMEVPVVTTHFGNEGIDARHGKEIFVADAPEEFAGYVVELLKDRNLSREMGRNARDFVKERFSWQMVVRRIDEISKQLNIEGKDGRN